MYTQKDWVVVEGPEKSIEITIDSSSVSLRLKATGTRVNKALLSTLFKYKPKKIPTIVENETIELFNQIINK